MAVNLTVNTDTEIKTGGYAWYALGLLAVANLLNYLDRSLIYILFTPIKKEMSFTDFQLGLLGTTSFVIFFTVLGVPFGRLADRSSRKNNNCRRTRCVESVLRSHWICK